MQALISSSILWISDWTRPSLLPQRKLRHQHNPPLIHPQVTAVFQVFEDAVVLLAAAAGPTGDLLVGDAFFNGLGAIAVGFGQFVQARGEVTIDVDEGQQGRRGHGVILAYKSSRAEAYGGRIVNIATVSAFFIARLRRLSRHEGRG